MSGTGSSGWWTLHVTVEPGAHPVLDAALVELGPIVEQRSGAGCARSVRVPTADAATRVVTHLRRRLGSRLANLDLQPPDHAEPPRYSWRSPDRTRDRVTPARRSASDDPAGEAPGE